MDEIEDLKAIILPSGRLVRLRELNPDEVDEVTAVVADTITGQTSLVTFQKEISKLGVKRMIVEVSKKKGLAEVSARPAREGVPAREAYDPRLDPKVEWTQFDAEHYKKLFSARDHEALLQIYSMLHEVSRTEAAMIWGKSIPVATK